MVKQITSFVEAYAQVVMETILKDRKDTGKTGTIYHVHGMSVFEGVTGRGEGGKSLKR